jgi:hypothetical protein
MGKTREMKFWRELGPRISAVSPAYRATLLLIRWAQVKTALTFLHFACTSSYITCRRLRDFYGETMGKYGQSYGQISTTNNFRKLFVWHLIVEAYRATLLFLALLYFGARSY